MVVEVGLKKEGEEEEEKVGVVVIEKDIMYD